jgi:hypothetical protein
MRHLFLSFATVFLIAPAPLNLIAKGSATTAVAHAATPSALILTREQTTGLMPPSVFFRGQTANIQGRNSSGIKLPGGKLILFALVDSSGYSSALQQTYQAYLLTEVPLTLGDQALGPGAYGFGFVEGNRMVVMDLGGNQILQTPTTIDDALSRPNPLQILPDSAASNRFRLYLGRRFAVLAPAPK